MPLAELKRRARSQQGGFQELVPLNMALCTSLLQPRFREEVPLVSDKWHLFDVCLIIHACARLGVYAEQIQSSMINPDPRRSGVYIAIPTGIQIMTSKLTTLGSGLCRSKHNKQPPQATTLSTNGSRHGHNTSGLHTGTHGRKIPRQMWMQPLAVEPRAVVHWRED